MTIKINDNWFIEKDQYNWILTFENEGEINEKTGKPVHTINRWYYPTLQLALLACLGKGAVVEGDFSMAAVEKLIDQYAAFKDEIIQACQKISDLSTKKK